MKVDASRAVTNISYNLLNLLQTATTTTGTDSFTYDAAGRKLYKTNTISSVNTYYIDGIQYEGGTISFIQVKEYIGFLQVVRSKECEHYLNAF